MSILCAPAVARVGVVGPKRVGKTQKASPPPDPRARAVVSRRGSKPVPPGVGLGLG